MTRQQFVAMAKIVKNIDTGDWTTEPPNWFVDEQRPERDRAATVAEAFIILAERFNPLFNCQRFLEACGLVEPVKRRKGSRVS
jgi:hypothetical protein